MKTFLTLIIVGLALLASDAHAQLYRVPGAPYLEQRPYQPLQPYTVEPFTVQPPVVRQAPDPNQYLPRQQTCFSTWTRTSAGAVLRTQCY